MTIPTTVMICGLLLAVVGALLLKRGRWPKRTGDTPHCGSCGYILTGLSLDDRAARCPECGQSSLPDGVRLGERHRRPGLAAAGGLLLLLGLAASSWSLQLVLHSIDWYHYRPTSWIIRDLDQPTPGADRRAWDELQRRRQAGKLSPENEREIVDACLRAQSRKPEGYLLREMMEHVADLADAGTLDPARKERFFEQAVVLALHVRPVIGIGDRVPFAVSCGGRHPTQRAWYATRHDQFFVDGQPLDLTVDSTGIPFLDGFEQHIAPACAGGHHILKAEVEITIGAGAWEFHPDLRPPPMFHHSYVLETPFDVVAAPPPVRRLHDASAGPAVQASLEAVYFRFDPRHHLLRGAVRTQRRPPLDLGFDVFARAGGREYAMGRAQFTKGMYAEYTLDASPFPDGFRRIDIVLRGSEAAVRESVGGNAYWDGEITFPVSVSVD